MRRIAMATVVLLTAALLGVPSGPASATVTGIYVPDTTVYTDEIEYGCFERSFALAGDLSNDIDWSVTFDVFDSVGNDVGGGLGLFYPDTHTYSACPSAVPGTYTYTVRGEAQETTYSDSSPKTTPVSTHFTVRIVKSHATLKRELIRRHGHKIWKFTSALTASRAAAYQNVRFEMKWKGEWSKVAGKMANGRGQVTFTSYPGRTSRFDPAKYKFRLHWMGSDIATRTFRMHALH